ncbi:hypothetical protein [Rhizobium sp. BK176]|uniref:hypothetical protein n=1 Tax=Rhizobium sp. BK176 TaxID=2587071 RepID=UPI0021691968|nr:hypothetical protein [Rhizobium sp. BK176]MCS4089318.1 hypothetical protein [Rhizobium sp. BK176]
MSVSLSKYDDAPFSLAAWIFCIALVLAFVVVFFSMTAQKKDFGEFTDTITFAEKIATLPQCQIAFKDYSRSGTCTDNIHGIRVMKSDRGLDFLDVSGEWEVIASVDNYSVDGRLERRVWESTPGTFERIEKAFGNAVR